MKLLSYLQTTHHLSRRTITQYIKDAKILVNGRIVEGFGTLLNNGDTIEIAGKKMGTYSPLVKDGTQVGEIGNQLILFNKPTGYVVSTSDPHNPTIFEILPKEYRHYYPIGRLDKESSGLVLLSNDPTLVHELSHPSKEHKKIYHVTLNKFLSDFHRDEMLKGVLVNHHGERIENIYGNTKEIPSSGAMHSKAVPFKESEAKGSGKISSKDQANDILSFQKIYAIKERVYEITLTEGKNRHIRRLCRALGYRVESLHRVSFGKRKLENLKGGETQIQKI